MGLNRDKEFKGTIIKKKNFKYGVGSFNKNTINIYNNFFDLITEEIYLQISVNNKFEQIILLIFQNIEIPDYISIISEKRFLYTLIKFLNTYRNKRTISIRI